MNLPFGLVVSKREAQPTQAAPAATGANWLENVLTLGDRKGMQIAAVYRCVNLISDGIAVMPLRLKYRPKVNDVFRTMETNDRERWHYLLNVKPNEYMSGYMLKKCAVMQMLLHGNAFIMCKNESGQVVMPSSGQVHTIHLLQSAPGYNQVSNKYTVADMYNRINGTYGSDYVIHLKNCPTDGGYWGTSVVSHARMTLELSTTSEQQALKQVANGGRGKYVLGYDQKDATFGTHSQKQKQAAALDVQDLLSKQDVVTLPSKEMTLQSLVMSANDMQFIQSREFSIKEIARWFAVPVYKLGEQTSNYKSVDAAQVDFYNEALKPLASQIEIEMHGKVTTAEDWYKYKFDFDETPLFSMDYASRAAWMKARLETGVASVNDLRHELDIESIPDGDTILMSANLKSISTLKNEGASATNKNVAQ